MRSDTDRIDALDDIADTAAMLGGLAAIILADIHAARGEPEQQRHTRPRLADDIRDTPPNEADPAEPPRPEDDEVRVYADPTGSRAVKNDPASRDLAELDRRLRCARGDMGVLLRIFQRHQAARTPAQIDDLRTVATGELDTEGDDWCRSHLRVAVLEPITLNKRDGTPYYRDMCRSCGDLLANLKNKHRKRFRTYRLPPIELVAIRTYRKLRESDIDALVGPQHRKSKAPKYQPGEDKKRRPA